MFINEKIQLKYLIFVLSLFFCIIVDKLTANPIKRQKDNLLQWKMFSSHYYHITNSPTSLSLDEIRETMHKAFNAWSLIAFSMRVKFQEFPSENYDMNDAKTLLFNISFESKNFEAYSGLPFSKQYFGYAIRNGNIYFNKNIKWRKYKIGEKVDKESIDFYSIALFTIGMHLEMDISDNETSIMYERNTDSTDTNENYIEPVFSESDWNKSYSSTWTEDLSIFNYTIVNKPLTLSMSDIQETMSKAFNTWSLLYTWFKAQEISFAEYSRQKHLLYRPQIWKISFESGNHTDSALIYDLPFTEKDAGHAIEHFAIHFNKDIKWRKYNVGEKVDSESTDFYSIALFTVAQLMGWITSKNESSIMYEGYKDSKDVNGNYIQPTFDENDLKYVEEEYRKMLELDFTEKELQEELQKVKEESKMKISKI